MSVRLALPDGTVVDADLCKGQASDRYHSIVKWELSPSESHDEEDLFARRILTNSDLAALFANAVESYYYLHNAF